MIRLAQSPLMFTKNYLGATKWSCILQMWESISASSSIVRRLGRPLGTCPFWPPARGCVCLPPMCPFVSATWLLTWLLIVGIAPGIESSKSSMYSPLCSLRWFWVLPLFRLKSDPMLPLPMTSPFVRISFPPKLSTCWRTHCSNSFWTELLSVSPSI